MNILSKKFLERFVEPKISIGGKWSIALVYPNGEEFFPFGKEKRKNLILDQGLDILAESKYFHPHDGLNYNTIPAFLSSTAVLGDGNAPLSTTNTALSNQKQEGFNSPGTASVSTDINTGSRTFKKVYNFTPPEEELVVTEIGLNTPFRGKNLFTRFILPSPIKILPQIFIRLFYDFTITQDAIINPINITASSGSIVADGEIKLCGRFDDIFMSMDVNGNSTTAFGDSPRTSVLPYYEEYCAEVSTCNNKCFGTCFMLEPNAVFPNLNTSIANEWVGERLEESIGTISASAYIAGNFYRDITYIFNNNNPINSESFGGFLFTVTKSNRQNTWDGWLWKFNNNQIKYNTKQLVIVLRQSVARI